MKLANYFYLSVLITAISCSSSNQLTIVNKEEVNKRKIAMEQLYEKIDASPTQKKQLRKLDKQLVRSFSEDIAGVIDNRVLLEQRLSELKDQEAKSFKSILSEEQFEVYSIYRQLQQQDLLSLHQTKSKYLATK